MRRPLLLLVVVIVLIAAAGVVALSTASGRAGLSPYLPAWLEKKPTFYLEAAARIIRERAARRDAVDWPATLKHAGEMIGEASTPEDTYPAIRYILDQLGDGHSTLYPPVKGVGSTGVFGFQTLFPDRVVAVVYPNSAAAMAGIRAGDVIESVNGAPPVASQDPRTRGKLVSVPPPTAKLRLRHPGEQESHEVTLTIGNYTPLPGLTHRIGGDLGYVEIPGTSGEDDFALRMRESIAQADAPTVCGWMIDLRVNNGGAMWAMLQAVRPILGETSPGSFISPSGQPTPWTFPTSGPFATPAPEHPLQHMDAPVAVLTSRITSGSAEVVAVAFRGRPPVTRSFGEPTWGGPSENTAFKLIDGAMLDLATSKAADRTGHVYEGPLVPDQPVAIDWSKLTATDDPVIVAAGTWLRSIVPCKK